MHVFATIVAGLLGAAAMSLLLATLRGQGWAKADVIRALGSMRSGSLVHAFRRGVLIHGCIGIAFAFPYVFILSRLRASHGLELGLLGGVVGFVHGLLVSTILIAGGTAWHPLKQFRGIGPSAGLAYVAGHVAYGAALGFTYTSLTTRWWYG